MGTYTIESRLRELFAADPDAFSLHRAATGSMLVDIKGAEKGFNERSDLLFAAADGTDLNDFWDEVQTAVNARNAQRNRIVDMLTFRVTDMAERVSVPTGGDDFEVATEYGLPKAVKVKPGNTFWRGYDFNFYDLAVRYTWMYIAEADIRALRQQTNNALEADNRLVFSRVMKTFFNPVNGVGLTDQNMPVTVYKFYNGDGEVPPPVGTTTFAGTHNHYVTTTGLSSSATLTPATVDAMQAHLDHHGYTLLAGYRKVLWVNTQEYNIIKNWKVANGATWDFIPDDTRPGGGVFVPDANGGRYVGAPGRIQGQVGTYGPWNVVQEDYVPAGYVGGIVTGGPDQISNPIGLREHANPSFRGLKIIPGDKNGYPLIESFFQRGLGTGIRHRGAGIVMQVSASATYTVPAIYA
jgi:hypothetical protein